MTEQMIQELVNRGFNRWTKGNMDRLYVNADTLGLECDYYKTGNICYATFQGEKISNTHAKEMRSAKTYIDVATGTVHSSSYTLECAVRNILDEIEQ